MSKRFALIGILMSLAAAVAAPPAQSAETSMTPELLWKPGRLGGSTVSADGRFVAFAVRHYELEEDKGASTIHIHEVATGKTRMVFDAKPGKPVMIASSTMAQRNSPG